MSADHTPRGPVNMNDGLRIKAGSMRVGETPSTKLDVLGPELAPKNNLIDKKSEMGLIPMDIIREFVLPAYEEGIIKYERESWRRGFYVSTMHDAAGRHLEKFYHKGEDIDPDAFKSGIMNKHHLAGVIFSCLSMLHTLKYHPELDNRRSPVDGALLSDINACPADKAQTTREVLGSVSDREVTGTD